MDQRNRGRSGRRLLTLPLTALLLTACAGVAQADVVAFNDTTSDPRRVTLEPGESRSLTARFSLTAHGTSHLQAGTFFSLQGTGDPDGATPGSPRMNVPSPWPDPFGVARPTASTTVSLRAPDAFGTVQFLPSWTPSSVQCVTGTSCVTGPGAVAYTVDVVPRRAEVTNILEDPRGARLSWAASPDAHRITGYTVTRWKKSDPSAERRTFSNLAPSATQVVDDGVAPGGDYCWSITAFWRDPTTGAVFTSRPDQLCRRMNAPATTPGPATGPGVDGDGDFTLTWSPSTPDVETLRYEVQGRDSDDGAWKAIGLVTETPSFGVTGLTGGTWRFRVRARGNYERTSSPWNEDGTPVKVDRAGPSAPAGSTRAPDTSSGEPWFKNEATVSWGGSADPALPDGSPGSGVQGYSPDETVSTHGERVVTGHARDAAGHESAAGSHTVRVDSKPPQVSFDCPTTPTHVGDDRSLRWTATDEGSGIDGSASGVVPVDTTARGAVVVRSPGATDRVGLTADPAECTVQVRAKPTKPGVPQAPSFDQDGSFGIGWDPSTDEDGDPFAYELSAHDEQSSFSPIADGLGEPRFTTDRLTEGTWTFAVRATEDGGATSDAAVAEDVTKVDGTAPSAPAATTDPVAPGPDADGWFKGRVAVSFGGSADPGLADGSAGSGVASYTAPATFDTSGEHRATGRATDRAGNPSAATAIDVKVDATAPVVELEGCPADPVLEGTRHVVRWTARDAHSGLATGTSGELTLDTRVPGDDKVADAPVARDRVGHEGTAACGFGVYANTAPGAPGAPNGPALDRGGQFGLTWGAATDVDTGAGDSITYEVERQDANDGDEWTPEAGGLATARRDVDVEDGTWRFRVRAVDSFGATSDWAVSDPVKVDGGGPTAPSASTTPAAPADNADGWYRDEASVSFGGSTDPDLRDGSAGSGVASYGGGATFTTTGTHTANGFAIDEAGNESARTGHTVKVDADAPRTEIACPAQTLIVGGPATAAWTASDAGAGLVTPADGAVELDTSSPGRKTATAPAARDRVGHETQGASCSYTVVYEFAGFSAPINGTAVNSGKTGRTYPVKWRLLRHDGSPIPDADAEALLSSMQVVQRDTSCTEFGSLSEDLLEESTSADTSLKYDAETDQFHYNYKAPPTVGCYILGIRNADGLATRQVNFNFTR